MRTFFQPRNPGNSRRQLSSESGIAEYWLVNLDQQEIEVYWQPAGQAFRFRELLRSGDMFKAKGLALEIDVAEIFS